MCYFINGNSNELNLNDTKHIRKNIQNIQFIRYWLFYKIKKCILDLRLW